MKKLVKLLIISLVGFLLISCGPTKPAETKVPETPTKETTTEPSAKEKVHDVVIIGAGGAGMSAAIAANEAGAVLSY